MDLPAPGHRDSSRSGSNTHKKKIKEKGSSRAQHATQGILNRRHRGADPRQQQLCRPNEGGQFVHNAAAFSAKGRFCHALRHYVLGVRHKSTVDSPFPTNRTRACPPPVTLRSKTAGMGSRTAGRGKGLRRSEGINSPRESSPYDNATRLGRAKRDTRPQRRRSIVKKLRQHARIMVHRSFADSGEGDTENATRSSDISGRNQDDGGADDDTMSPASDSTTAAALHQQQA